jgi:hypothetical protein
MKRIILALTLGAFTLSALPAAALDAGKPLASAGGAMAAPATAKKVEKTVSTSVKKPPVAKKAVASNPVKKATSTKKVCNPKKSKKCGDACIPLKNTCHQ